MLFCKIKPQFVSLFKKITLAELFYYIFTVFHSSVKLLSGVSLFNKELKKLCQQNLKAIPGTLRF